MTAGGTTKAQLEKRVKELEEQIELQERVNSAYEDKYLAYLQAIVPLITISRTMVKIHESRRTHHSMGIDIGVRLDTLQRIAALEIPREEAE